MHALVSGDLLYFYIVSFFLLKFWSRVPDARRELRASSSAVLLYSFTRLGKLRCIMHELIGTFVALILFAIEDSLSGNFKPFNSVPGNQKGD